MHLGTTTRTVLKANSASRGRDAPCIRGSSRESPGTGYRSTRYWFGSSLLHFPLLLRSSRHRHLRRLQDFDFVMGQDVGGAVRDAPAAPHEEQRRDQDDREEAEANVVAGGEAEEGEGRAAGLPAEEDEERTPHPAADPAGDHVDRQRDGRGTAGDRDGDAQPVGESHDQRGAPRIALHYGERGVEQALLVGPARANPVDAPSTDEVQRDGRDPRADRDGQDHPGEPEPTVPRRDPAEDRVRLLEDDARDAERDVLPEALERRDVLGVAVRRGGGLQEQR